MKRVVSLATPISIIKYPLAHQSTMAANVPSSCLSQEENDLLFTLIGNRKQTKATAVVQLFQAKESRTQWTKFKTGVVCFVKDNVKKSYYIRLFDLSVSD